MANILLLIDQQSEISGISNNWFVFQDNVDSVIQRMAERHNTCAACDYEWNDTIKTLLTEMVTNFYSNHSFKMPLELIPCKIQVKILNDDLFSIPNNKISYMFIFNEGKDSVDYRIIEDQIAGYAIKLILEDLGYDHLTWRGTTYNGEDIGYSMTDRATCNRQHADIFFKENSEKMTLDCYQIRNFVS